MLLLTSLFHLQLIGKSHCKMCQSQTSLSDQTDVSVKKDEIVELNKWKPKSKETQKQETKDQRGLFIPTITTFNIPISLLIF